MRPLLARIQLGRGGLFAQMGQVDKACADLSAARALLRRLEMACWLPQAESALAQARLMAIPNAAAHPD
jgi:hypothetical protein